MKLPVTVLSIEPKTAKSGNEYALAQVIFHDTKITAGPCMLFGDVFQSIKDGFVSGTKYEAEIVLQPERQGTSVEISSLSPLKAAATPLQAAAK